MFLKESERNQIAENERQIAKHIAERAKILREARVREAGGEQALREAQRAAIEESHRQFESRMGFADISEHGRRILRFGRSGFDPSYNSRTRGKRVDGFGLGTLPAA